MAEELERKATTSRQLISHFRDKCQQDPAGAMALLSADVTAGRTLAIAQLELGLLTADAVQGAAEDERSASGGVVGGAQPPEGYTPYQLDLLRQVTLPRHAAAPAPSFSDPRLPHPTLGRPVSASRLACLQVAALTSEMMQGLSPFQQQQLLTLQHMTRASRVLERVGR
jgi:hypothetical protein